jgi:hypothetical protein
VGVPHEAIPEAASQRVLADFVSGQYRRDSKTYLVVKLKAHSRKHVLQRDGHGGIIGRDLKE